MSRLTVGWGEKGKRTPSERSVTKSSIAKARAFNLSFSLGVFVSLDHARYRSGKEGEEGRDSPMKKPKKTYHLVKVFCCTLTHCFSTVNIFNSGRRHSRADWRGD